MALIQARADLARLQAEIKRLENQLVSARERAEKVSHYIEMAELYSSGAGVTAATTRTRNGRSAAAAEAVVEILTRKGHPVPTRDLLKELSDKGIIFDTPNPVTNLSSTLSRNPLLVGDRSEGWSLKEWKSQGDRSDATFGAPSPSGADDDDELGLLDEEEEEEDENPWDVEL